MITKRELCIMFNLDPDDCDYVSLCFEVNKGGEHGRTTFASIADDGPRVSSYLHNGGIRTFETRN